MPLMRTCTTQVIVLAVAGAAILSSCASSRERPEIAVQRLPLLVVPPDFELLPPQPGEPRPSRSALQDQTLDVVFGGPSRRSEVERDILSHAGTAAAGIRSEIGDLRTHTAAKGRITQNILAAPPGEGRVAQAFIGDVRPEA